MKNSQSVPTLYAVLLMPFLALVSVALADIDSSIAVRPESNIEEVVFPKSDLVISRVPHSLLWESCISVE